MDCDWLYTTLRACIAHQPFWMYFMYQHQQHAVVFISIISDAIEARPLLAAYYYPVPSDSDQANPGHSSSSRTLSSPTREADGTSCARNNAAAPPPRLVSRGANHGALRRREDPDAGVHPGGAVQHGRPGRRHGGRQVGRLRPARVRPLAPHAAPLPCPAVGGGTRAAPRRHRRGQRAGRRPRDALRARRPPVQRPQEEEERRRGGGAGAVRAGRHPHRQLDTGHGPLRPHAHPRQGRRHRKDRRHALVPGRDGHHQEGGRAGVRRAHGGHGPGRPPGPRHSKPPRHPGRDRDGAGQVRGSGEEGAAGGEAAQPQVRGRQGAPHRQRLHAPHHPSSAPPRCHARRRIPRRHAPPLIRSNSMSDYSTE